MNTHGNKAFESNTYDSEVRRLRGHFNNCDGYRKICETNAGLVARELGGGGHSRAAAAMIVGGRLPDVARRVRALLPRAVKPTLRVAEVIGEKVDALRQSRVGRREVEEDRRLGEVAAREREEVVEVQRHEVEEYEPLVIAPPVAEIPKSQRLAKERQRMEIRARLGAEVRDEGLGYLIASGGSGYALQKLPQTCFERVSASCRMRTRLAEGTRNGMLCFGPATDPASLVKAGVYIGAGELVIQHGGFGEEEALIRLPVDFEKEQVFKVSFEANLRTKRLRLVVDGVELLSALRKDWSAVSYVGYTVTGTETEFSTLGVRGG